MLSELLIEDFAIIDRLHLRFQPGFTVMTGETGAGKSIIIDALQAALGARSSADMVRGNAKFASVEAVFDVGERESEGRLDEILNDSGIEPEGCLILRREVGSSGRSTARVNGRAVPMSALAAIGAQLVDIHGQSEHLSILRRDKQLEVLDRYGGLRELRTSVSEATRELGRQRRFRDELISGQSEAEQRLDLLQFQLNELESAHLRSGEEDELLAERNLLLNTERLTQLSASAYELLQGESPSAVDLVQRAAAALADLAVIDPTLLSLSSRMESAAYDLEDAAQEVRSYRDSVEYDPDRLIAAEERLDMLTRLKRKYGPTIDDVMTFTERARTEMEDVINLEDRIADAERRAAAAEAEAGNLALQLSTARRRVAEELSAAMHSALQGLGLQATRFAVEVTQEESDQGVSISGPDRRFAYSSSGIDSVSFLVSFNPGEPMRPLDRVASGGETSRFLLALKSVLASADQTPTLIFDEVDVGVGGRAAVSVGERLRDLGGSHQVMSITHLPQIAALADQHLSVSKAVLDGRTMVAIDTLEGAERVSEIAHMMTGTGTDAARRNAEELLASAQEGR